MSNNSGAFGTGYDENQTKTYRDLARVVKEMQPREVNPSAYEDVLLLFETLQEFLTSEDARLTQLGNDLATRIKALEEGERKLALEKRAIGLVPRSRDGEIKTHVVERVAERKGWGFLNIKGA